MKQSPKIFSRQKVIQNKLKAIKNAQYNLLSPQFYHPPLEHITDQISYIKRDFKNMAFIGPGINHFLKTKPSNVQLDQIFLCDIHQDIVQHHYNQIDFSQLSPQTKILPLVIDEELWCFQPEQLDMIISSSHLHWVNDLQVTLNRFLESLKPDGILIGNIFGEQSLQELRIAFTLAESERSGGISQHVSPFISIVEAGNLLSRCKFNLPTVYAENRDLKFDNSLEMMQFLQDLGENDALLHKREGLHRDVLYSTLAIYNHLFKNEEKVHLSIEDVFITGWKYHESQQKPKERGSAEFSLKTLTEEINKYEPDVKVKSGSIEEEKDDEK